MPLECKPSLKTKHKYSLVSILNNMSDLGLDVGHGVHKLVVLLRDLGVPRQELVEVDQPVVVAVFLVDALHELGGKLSCVLAVERR